MGHGGSGMVDVRVGAPPAERGLTIQTYAERQEREQEQEREQASRQEASCAAAGHEAEAALPPEEKAGQDAKDGGTSC